MSIADCAEMLHKSDPDRFMATMTAPPEIREKLFPLFAFNLEVARAAWASQEPLVCQMRLQYWRDVIEATFADTAVPNHPVATPFSRVIKWGGLSKDILLDMIDARYWDIGYDPFNDTAELLTYLEHTTGVVTEMAARLCGVPDHHYDVIRSYGTAIGLANFLLAVPELKARGRQPLPDESPAALARLAQEGLDMQAQVAVAKPILAGPALRTGWDSTRVLKRVVRQPERVLEGRLQTSPFRRNLSMLLIGLLGR